MSLAPQILSIRLKIRPTESLIICLLSHKILQTLTSTTTPLKNYQCAHIIGGSGNSNQHEQTNWRRCHYNKKKKTETKKEDKMRGRTCQTANGQPFGEPMSLIGSNNY